MQRSLTSPLWMIIAIFATWSGNISHNRATVFPSRKRRKRFDASWRRRPRSRLLDIMMPGRRRLTVCRQLRTTTELPVIFRRRWQTGRTDRRPGTRRDDYITKPLTRANSWQGIRACCGASTASRPSGRIKAKSMSLRRLGIDTGAPGAPRARCVSVALSTAEFRLLNASWSTRPGGWSRDQLLDLTAGRAPKL